MCIRDSYETDYIHGNESNSKVSDLLTMTGLDARNHDLVQVTACVNQSTGLLSGVTTSWAKWSGGVQTDVKRLNIIGQMSGLYHFNDSVSVSEEADYTLQEYWFQEASPVQEEWYRDLVIDSDWTSER